MNDPLARGLPPIDDEYQGPAWWHFSRLADARHSRGMRRIAALGLVVLAVSMTTGVLNVAWDWNGLPLRIGQLDLPVTIHPPFVLSLLAAVWLGPTWGLVPAYTANLASGLTGGLSPLAALLSPWPEPSRCSSSGARWSRSTSAPSSGAGATPFGSSSSA